MKRGNKFMAVAGIYQVLTKIDSHVKMYLPLHTVGTKFLSSPHHLLQFPEIQPAFTCVLLM